MTDFHLHTTFCDGKNSPEEMVCAAIAKGLSAIGFSGHGYTFYDESYCMSKEGTLAYIEDIHRLQQKYQDQIRIACGIEQDFYAGIPDTTLFDYVIGSVHYLQFGNTFIPMDETAEMIKQAADTFFGGDIYTLIEYFFDTAAQVATAVNPDIIGHFDLISKFNEKNPLFDESHPRYHAAWKRAADKLLFSKKPFELNTGAVSRSYRTHPYPSAPIFSYLLQNGATFLINSDSHQTTTIGADGKKWRQWFIENGYRDQLLDMPTAAAAKWRIL